LNDVWFITYYNHWLSQMARSRGNRVIAPGNLSSSMRDNYHKLGVSEYYKKIGSTYRNPHFPGIRLCLFSWLNRWWQMEGCKINQKDRIFIFDMACGSGEVTLAFGEWWKTGSELYRSLDGGATASGSTPHRKALVIPPLSPDFCPLIVAADPYTATAYQDRTSLTCATLSFTDISEGALPPFAFKTSSVAQHHGPQEPESSDKSQPPQCIIEMVICSFALHLVESTSLLFSLLWELSLKTHWLVVLAPHKKPEIKDGWGWQKWNIQLWEACQMVNNTGELLDDRVHCRVYKSLNIRRTSTA